MRRGTFVPVETVAIGFSYPPLARSPILDQLGPATVAVVAPMGQPPHGREDGRDGPAQTADATETDRAGGPRRWSPLSLPRQPIWRNR